jgi:hypothetical protein
MAKQREFRNSDSVIPTNSTGAYADGDNIGGLLEFNNLTPYNGGPARIDSVVLSDLDEQGASIDVILFGANPTNTTFTDNAELDVHDTDILEIVGVVSLNTTSYVVFADNQVAFANDVGLGFKLNGTSVLYAALVSRGTPTYDGSTTDLQLTISVS